MQILGSVQSTAQVHPEKLTKAMMAAAESRGAQVKIGTVQSIVTDESPAARVTGHLQPHSALHMQAQCIDSASLCMQSSKLMS